LCEIDIHKGVLIGVPIINAVELEKEQEWVGIGCHISCKESDIFEKQIRYHPYNVIPYQVPLKVNHKHKSEFAVNWFGTETHKSEERLKEKINEYSEINVYREKWENALIFYEKTGKYLNQFEHK